MVIGATTSTRMQLWLAQVEGLFALVWRWLALDAVLRLLWLARPDPFGNPLVGKVDWYWFHAVGLDSIQGAQLALPGLVVLSLLGLCGGWTTGWKASKAITMILLLFSTAFGLVDAELMRFVGTHFSWTLLVTYGNPASFGEIPRMIATDAGGPFLNALLVLTIPALGWWQWRVMPIDDRRWPRRTVAYLALATAGWLLTAVVWSGSARDWKLQPPVSLLWQELQTRERGERPPQIAARGLETFKRAWTAGNPHAPSVFAWPTHPLVHLTAHRACMALAAGQLDAATTLNCQQDRDGDGFVLALDCDDSRADIHPKALEVGGDGIDQDCSGIDAQPYNVLLIVLESHRSLGVGHISGQPSWSPRLDQLAKRGVSQRRNVSAGMPTIASFMAIYTGLLPPAWAIVATDFATATLPSLPATLRQHGYYTRFVSAADPSWDNQHVWLRQWFEAVDYDRSREEDADMFAHLAKWLRTELTQAAKGRPFFVVATSRSNHFPFPRVAGVPVTGSDAWPDRMRDTMGYADAAMGTMLDTLASEPWFARTLVIVTGDHGYPLGEHGNYAMYQSVHVETTGVPLVVAGDHPKLQRLRAVVTQEPASHLDIAPTVLDLLGIDPSGAWMGRSLVAGGLGYSWTVKDGLWASEIGARRLLAHATALDTVAHWQVFDRLVDWREDHPLAPLPSDREALADVSALAGWMYDLYRQDRIVPVALVGGER